MGLRINKRTELCIAADADQGIPQAVDKLSEWAMKSGIYAVVMVDGGGQTCGPSTAPEQAAAAPVVARIILSNEPVDYLGVDDPDLVILLSEAGAGALGTLDHLRRDSLVVVVADVPIPQTPARIERFDLPSGVPKPSGADLALQMLVDMLAKLGCVEEKRERGNMGK